VEGWGGGARECELVAALGLGWCWVAPKLRQTLSSVGLHWSVGGSFTDRPELGSCWRHFSTIMIPHPPSLVWPESAPPGPGEVFLWWIQGTVPGLDEPGAWGLLEEGERAQAGAFKFDRDRVRFIRRRAFLRCLLGAALDRGPGELTFTLGLHGKPFLVRQEGDPDLRFSLSHSVDHVVVALAMGREIGVDVEAERPPETLHGLPEGVFHPDEWPFYDQLDGDQARSAAFFRAWSRKESVLKALGTGFSRDPTSLFVGLEAHEPLVPWVPRTPDGGDALEGLGQLCDLNAPPGCCAALSVEGTGWRVEECLLSDRQR